MEEDGIRPVDHAYRDEVDAIFKEIYREGRFDVMPREHAPRLAGKLPAGSDPKRSSRCLVSSTLPKGGGSMPQVRYGRSNGVANWVPKQTKSTCQSEGC